jgi:hypothetical protein
MDPEMETKKAQALAGMQARQSEREKLKQVSSLDQDATKAFLTWFTAARQKVDGLITQAPSLTPEVFPAHFLAISTELELMQQRTAEATNFLPSHDMAQSKAVVAEFQKNLQTLKTNLVPRAKFGFRSRATKQDQKENSVPETRPVVPDNVAATLQRLVADTPVIDIARLENQVVYKGPGDLGGSDVMLSELKHCTISLADVSGALRAHRLQNCTVLCGPISGSFFVEDAKDCVFVIAARQGRIHKAVNCEFRIGVTSKPIIENCSNCRFGPYTLEYDQLTQQIENAGLTCIFSNDLWKDVQDFNWLKVDASPNWSLKVDSAKFVPVRPTIISPAS